FIGGSRRCFRTFSAASGYLPHTLQQRSATLMRLSGESRRGMQPTFFPSAADFRGWLDRHHATALELLVGFYRKASGRGITYPEALDEALSFGWIDGVRKRIDAEAYAIRFTPRKPGSIWSAVNIERVRELTSRGLMKPPGLRVFRE